MTRSEQQKQKSDGHGTERVVKEETVGKPLGMVAESRRRNERWREE